MRRTGARLTLSGAMARQTQLDPLETSEVKSSSLTKAEKEVKALKQENQKLRSDLSEIRCMYNQLVQENSHEKFDERRVTLLKSQIIQLERQLLLFSEALSSRSATLFEVENNLQWLADKCRSLVCKDVRGPQVPVDRAELTLMIETAESARIKLYKQIENKTTENLSRPLRFTTDFLQPGMQKDVTLLEVASGDLNHLNIKHVTKLETKMSSLYKELIQLHSIMETETSNESAYLWTSCHVTSVARERLMTQVLKACAMMKDCSSDLLDLSMLFPSAPWPPLKRCALKEVTAERVLGCLATRSRAKSEDTNQLIQALVKAYNYKTYMLQNQNKCLREEVKYHQRVYNLQLKYTESLFQAIREAYASFEETSNDLIVKPLNVVLEAYLDLSQSASESSLKAFLNTFKSQATQLTNIVETLQLKEGQESDGSKVLSQYGEEFFQALEKLVKTEQTRRDKEAGRIEEVRNEQTRLDQELRDLLEEQEYKQQQIMMTSSESVQQKDMTSSEFGDDHDKISKVSNDNRQVENATVQDDFIKGLRQDAKMKAKLKENPLHDKEWVSILDDNRSESSRQEEKVTKGKQNQKPLHTKEWVSIIDNNPIERGLSELSLESKEKNSYELSDAELYEQHAKGDFETEVLLEQELIDLGPNKSISASTANEKPPKVKKKKLNYVPNTFVPNRTLQLRRSGSASRLSSKDETPDSSQKATDSKPVSQEEVTSEKGKKQTQGKFAGIPRKPAFR